MTTHKKQFRAYLPMIIGGVILLVAIGVIIHMIGGMEDKPAKKEKKIQAISLMKPPPPPPPPPKVEKPPEPEVEKLQEKVEQEPEEIPDVADEPPPGDLGLDAEGSAGSDGFGLAAHKGGDILSEREELRRKGYTAVVKVWVELDGSVKRFELARGSNDAEIDELLNRLLSKYRKVNEPLPPGMELPIKLKITSRI
ncbi:MAG: TonB C-terminal domain-containing protein [Methylobacter sp.]|nr:TonB C-terminal domain-containing protein [Methylobacter sp.]